MAPVTIVKLIVKMNQADSESIFKITGPNRSVPEKFNSYAGPVKAPIAINELTDVIVAIVDKAIIPFVFELKKRRAIIARTTNIIKILINATDLKLFLKR